MYSSSIDNSQKWDLPNYPIDTIVAEMNKTAPVSKYSNGASYEQIATEYIDVCVSELLKNINKNNSITEISLSKIKNKCKYTYQRKHRWYDWLYNNYPLWQIIQKGYHISDQYNQLTQIKLMMPVEHLVAYRFRNSADRFIQSDTDTESLNIWRSEIDTDSLEAFIMSSDVSTVRNIISAKNILDLAKQNNNVLEHNWHIDNFGGRIYLTGANNLQNGCAKQVREAALGNCYRYDIKSSMYAYMLHTIKTEYPDVKLPYICQIVYEKNRVRQQLATECLQNTNAPDSTKHNIIKRALNAMGFGANPRNPLSKIAESIYSKSDRIDFANNEFVQGLRTEILLYQQIIKHRYRTPELKPHTEHLKSESGRITINRLCSFDYQLHEAGAIQRMILELSLEPIMIVHDCVYVKQLIDPYCNIIIQNILGEHAKFEIHQVKAWQDRSKWEQNAEQEQQHYSRIAQEERTAHNYNSSNAVIQTSHNDAWDDQYLLKKRLTNTEYIV